MKYDDNRTSDLPSAQVQPFRLDGALHTLIAGSTEMDLHVTASRQLQRETQKVLVQLVAFGMIKPRCSSEPEPDLDNHS
jgi:hypothetical protein